MLYHFSWMMSTTYHHIYVPLLILEKKILVLTLNLVWEICKMLEKHYILPLAQPFRWCIRVWSDGENDANVSLLKTNTVEMRVLDARRSWRSVVNTETVKRIHYHTEAKFHLLLTFLNLKFKKKTIKFTSKQFSNLQALKEEKFGSLSIISRSVWVVALGSGALNRCTIPFAHTKSSSTIPIQLRRGWNLKIFEQLKKNWNTEINICCDSLNFPILAMCVNGFYKNCSYRNNLLNMKFKFNLNKMK